MQVFKPFSQNCRCNGWPAPPPCIVIYSSIIRLNRLSLWKDWPNWLHFFRWDRWIVWRGGYLASPDCSWSWCDYCRRPCSKMDKTILPVKSRRTCSISTDAQVVFRTADLADPRKTAEKSMPIHVGFGGAASARPHRVLSCGTKGFLTGTVETRHPWPKPASGPADCRVFIELHRIYNRFYRTDELPIIGLVPFSNILSVLRSLDIAQPLRTWLYSGRGKATPHFTYQPFDCLKYWIWTTQVCWWVNWSSVPHSVPTPFSASLCQ